MQEMSANGTEVSWSDVGKVLDDEMSSIEDIRTDLVRNDKGNVCQSIDNCMTVFQRDPLLKSAIRKNELSGKIDIVGEMGWERTSCSVTDTDVYQLHWYLEKQYGLKNERNINKALNIVASENRYHPIRKYLEQLAWDGKYRIGKLLPKYLGAEDDAYTKEIMQLLMLAAIHRIYEPGCKYEIMVCLVINPEHMKGCTGIREKNSKREWLPHQKELIERLVAIRGMTSISVSINCEKTNVIMGTEIHTLWGKERITDTIFVRDVDNCFARTGDGIAFSISPLSFYQVNPVQTEKLYSLALSYAGLSGKESVWDLYCGIGTISLFLSGRASKVYGVEVVPQAIEDAKQNAANNGITNAEFFAGKAEEVLPEFYEKQAAEVPLPKQTGQQTSKTDAAGADMLHPDVIVVDPPRKGCDEACLSTMLKMQPSRIVYVSCDSATLARDLKVLCEGGYEIKRIRGVDQFAQTVHVETCCLLTRIK